MPTTKKKWIFRIHRKKLSQVQKYEEQKHRKEKKKHIKKLSLIINQHSAKFKDIQFNKIIFTKILNSSHNNVGEDVK